MSAREWSEQGSLMEEAQGPFAPDLLAETPVYSRRFVRPGEEADTWEVLTSYATASMPEGFSRDHAPDCLACEAGESSIHAYEAPDEPNDDPEVYDVATCDELVICRDLDDVGGTELGSEYQWGYANMTALRAGAADSLARAVVANLDPSQI